MAYTVLDIGAGSPSFGKSLRYLNPQVKMLVLCGEPQWGVGPFFRPLHKEKLSRLLLSDKIGTKRIESSYGDFKLPDNSLDLVTLNAPHPLMMPWGIVPEIQRCLKKGGLFFSSWPKIPWNDVPTGFSLVKEGQWSRVWKNAKIPKALLPNGSPTTFPLSPFIQANIIAHRYGDPRRQGTSYIYFDGISPGYSLWQKPL